MSLSFTKKVSSIILNSLESRKVKKRLLDGGVWLRQQQRLGNMLAQHPVVVTELLAAVYVFSGVSQPLLMTICKDAGLADPVAQLFMVFYYLGPCLFVFITVGGSGGDQQQSWPSMRTRIKASGIAVFDIAAQAMNFTGASLAGPVSDSVILF